MNGRSRAAAATAHLLATQTAADILRSGGNAVDAAVAGAWALSVCEPSASGLGGQTTLLLHQPGQLPRVIDGHSHAPRGASLHSVSGAQQRRGHRACVVPSTVAALAYAHRRYGRLTRTRVMADAIRLAEDGFEITALLRRQISIILPALPASSAMRKIFVSGGNVPPVGSRLRQPGLAATLRRLQSAGEQDFYRGAVAKEIVADMRLHGGLIDAEDLAAFALPVERAAEWRTFRGHRVVTVPSPGGGLQVLDGLTLLEHLEPTSHQFTVDEWRSHIAQATCSVFRRRERVDREARSPDAVGCIRDPGSSVSLDVGNDAAERWRAVEEPGDTTHLTVADTEGNVVALTQSIQSVFGAKVANETLGFVYNNYLRTCPRRPRAFQLAPGCIPRSNVAPTIVFDGQSNRPVLALGAAGSRRITSAILQVISAVLDRGLSLEDAICGPRVHGLASRKVWLERPAATDHLKGLLSQWCARTVVKSSHHFSMGCVQALQFFQDGTVEGAADPRRDGTASGI